MPLPTQGREPLRIRAVPPAPLETSPAFLETSPVLLETSPAPLETSPVLLETSPAPLETSPVLLETSPALLETSPGVRVGADPFVRAAVFYPFLSRSFFLNPCFLASTWVALRFQPLYLQDSLKYSIVITMNIQTITALEKTLKDENILKKYQLEKIGVLGSFARGEKANDIDFYIDLENYNINNLINLKKVLEKITVKEVAIMLKKYANPIVLL